MLRRILFFAAWNLALAGWFWAVHHARAMPMPTGLSIPLDSPKLRFTHRATQLCYGPPRATDYGWYFEGPGAPSIAIVACGPHEEFRL